MGIFEWLEGTAGAQWVGDSLWGYPILLGLHVVGLAIFVGIVVMLDLRLLGSFKGLRVESFLPVMKFAWIGFVINAISGTLLFASQATIFVTDTQFLLKIGLVFVGAVTAGVIQHKIRNSEGANCRALAAFSLVAWIGAIVTGRLIAYL